VTPVSEPAANVCRSNEHGIALAGWIEAAKLISMDSQSLCDDWDLQFMVIKACLHSAENS